MAAWQWWQRQRKFAGSAALASVSSASMAVAAAATCNPSVAAEGCVLMTPGGQGPRARVGQGPCAPEVERHVPQIASGLVKVGGEA